MQTRKQQLFDIYGNNFITRRVLEKNPYAPIQELIELTEEMYFINTSEFLFPGDICLFYPEVTEYHTKIDRYCDISHGLIKAGSLYLVYRPFIKNLTLKKNFVLKRSMQTEPGYLDFFPKTLSQFEQLAMNLNMQINSNDGYDYFDLSRTQGENLTLLQLGKSRKKTKEKTKNKRRRRR